MLSPRCICVLFVSAGSLCAAAPLRTRSRKTSKAFKGPKGMFDFVTERPGTYEFNVQVLDAGGTVLHTDFAQAIIPSLNPR